MPYCFRRGCHGCPSGLSGTGARWTVPARSSRPQERPQAARVDRDRREPVRHRRTARRAVAALFPANGGHGRPSGLSGERLPDRSPRTVPAIGRTVATATGHGNGTGGAGRSGQARTRPARARGTAGRCRPVSGEVATVDRPACHLSGVLCARYAHGMRTHCVRYAYGMRTQCKDERMKNNTLTSRTRNTRTRAHARARGGGFPFRFRFGFGVCFAMRSGTARPQGAGSGCRIDRRERLPRPQGTGTATGGAGRSGQARTRPARANGTAGRCRPVSGEVATVARPACPAHRCRVPACHLSGVPARSSRPQGAGHGAPSGLSGGRLPDRSPRTRPARAFRKFPAGY